MTGATSRPRTQVRGIGANGVIACRRCHHDGVITPVHPLHPRSPFCQEHYEQNRKDARRQWRDRQQEKAQARRLAASATDGAERTAGGSLILSPSATAALELAMHRWSTALAEAGETIHLASGQLPTGVQKTLARAVEYIETEVAAEIAEWIAKTTPSVEPRP